jgi:hypothetical protein
LGCFFFRELVKGGFVELFEAGGADGFGLLEQVGDVSGEASHNVATLQRTAGCDMPQVRKDT